MTLPPRDAGLLASIVGAGEDPGAFRALFVVTLAAAAASALLARLLAPLRPEAARPAEAPAVVTVTR